MKVPSKALRPSPGYLYGYRYRRRLGTPLQPARAGGDGAAIALYFVIVALGMASMILLSL